jgi:hypothetical protein
MLKITEENYAYYKKLFAIVWEHISKDLPPNLLEHSPIKQLDEDETKSMSYARKCLQAGIGDLLVMMKEMPAASKDVFNTTLIENGFPAANVLIAKIRNSVSKVLERGSIKNLDEYYLMKEVICDTDLEDLTNSEREKLEKITSAFEQRKIGK